MEPIVKTLRKEQRCIDNQVVEYSLGLLKPFYCKRRDALKQIPRFWSIVVSETEPLQPYINFEDSLAFDALEDLFIEWDTDNPRNFSVTFQFGDNPHFGAQVLRKRLEWHPIESEDDDNDGYYTSPEPTPIKWKPESTLISQHMKGGDESFFTWFEYTTTDKLEDRQENTTIAQILVDEIYPTAIDLYSTAQDDQEVAEEYDISDDDT